MIRQTQGDYEKLFMSVPGEDYASNSVVMVMMSTFYNNDRRASNLQQGVFLTDELLWF